MLKFLTLFLLSTFFAGTFAMDAVTVNTPPEWSSMRSKGVVYSVVLDTAKLAKEKVRFTLNFVNNGKIKRVASKTISGSKVTDSLVFLPNVEKILGGTKFYSLAWNTKSGKINSKFEPIGTAPNSLLDTTKLFIATSNSDVLEKIASFGVLFKANEKALSIEIDKKDANGKITLAFDPANKKVAFGTFADRFIEYNSKTDSLRAYYYKRSITESKIVYREKKWLVSISKSLSGDKVVLTISWADLGLRYFDGRIMGLAIFTTEGKSLPVDAKLHIPATWGNILIKK